MKKGWCILIIAVLVNSCSKNNDSSTPETVNDPVAVKLEFPLKNSECTLGVDQGLDKTLIEFKWANAENDSYELVLENLSSNQVTRTTTEEHFIEIQLDKNTPYKWYVVSKTNSSVSEKESEHWSFYSAGTGVSNYAPFPADLISPKQSAQFDGSSEQIKLEWNSIDIDGDVVTYDIYVGNESPPSEKVAEDITETVYYMNSHTIGQLYWMVVAKDEKNNSSNSKIGNFIVGQETGIISFEIQNEGEGFEAFIDEEKKEIQLTLGNFAYEKLTPEILMKDGYSISPESGETFNFHDDLFYTVKDPNGIETIFKVLVKSGQHMVKSFIVKNGNEKYYAKIDEDSATITIQLGNFSYASITPEIEVSSKATVESSEVTQMDLTEKSTFMVTSEIGTTKEYSVVTPITISHLYSYFKNPGFNFTTSNIDTGYKVFAGSTQYLNAYNIQNQDNILIELLNLNGDVFAAEVFRSSYSHQHSYEESLSSNRLTVVIPYDLPEGSYSLRISEGERSTSYPHHFEVINDDRLVRITEINKTDFSRGDTLKLKGVNLRKEFAIKSDGSIYGFNEYVNGLSVNQEGTELELIFTTNTYGHLKSWTGNNEKPMAIQTLIEGYEHKLNSNIVYFNVN
ncbi:hypothetical protein GGR42_003122 [Saonia flava]|uniref:Uncharacterized protein n=1 Tax=Saonia flava TaxID=523696 RepID=A0A846QWB8_9FLAO|nr:hypothetical protein [Saonia flava]NJB72631.1 hypothetical protein [Saonia flava]